MELKNDDHQAFEEIYERYADKLIAIVLKKTGDEDDAMDMVQELFLSVWKNRHTIQVNGVLEAYLVVSVNYMICRWYKKQKQQPQSLHHVTEEQEQCEDSTSQKLLLAELSFLINQEIANMPEKMRQVYLYSREQDMNGQQIAAQLGVSHQTVRNQISNALSRLKKSVQKYYNVIPFDNFSEFLLLIIFFRHL
nr:sigma-70 family RNA polymerase sigma factor [Mucilaginibacter sp. SP1R1]